jgi:hypothetical protein
MAYLTAQMEVAALVISILALVIAVMALPTAFQMLWGAPLLVGCGDRYKRGDDLHLAFAISNRPVRGFLRRFGVSRSPVEICAIYKVTEHGTGRVVAVSRRARLKTDQNTDAVLQVSLHAMVSPARFVVAVYRPLNGCEVPEHSEGAVPLPQGQYVAHVEINAHDGNFWGWSQSFVVGTDAEGTYWQGDAKRSAFDP